MVTNLVPHIAKGLVIGLLAAGFGYHIGGPSEASATGAAWVLFAISFVGVTIAGTVKGDRAARQELEERRREEAARRKRILQEADEAQRRDRRQREDAIKSNSETAIRIFASLPESLQHVRTHRNSAVRHFRAGAFSPFWSAIEESYTHLGRYNEGLGSLARCGAIHAEALEGYAAKFRTVDHLPPFPVDINAVQATRVGEEAAQDLGSLVYEAQKQPVFAQIWEQRRTTAAVVQGFRNLEQVVSGLAGTLRVSIAALESAIERHGTQVRSSVDRALLTMEETAASTSLAGDSLQRGLSSLDGQVSSAVWYLRQEWKRELLR